MIFVLGLIAGTVFGIIISALIFGLNKDPYNNSNHTPLADAELRRLHERMQDYYNNPVVEYMKRRDHKRY